MAPLPLPRHPTALMISNPAARGTGRVGALRSAVGILAESGWTIRWRESLGSGHATDLAATAAAAGTDVVVAAGGDGTVNEVLNGLIGTGAALGILPAGTGNVLAAQLGLVGVPTPLHRAQPEAAAKRLAAGATRLVDAGLAEARGTPGRHFLMAAGVGLDAAVATEIEGPARDLKRAIGPAAFGALGLKTILAASGTEAIVRCDGARWRGRLLLAVVSNIRLYGGAVELTPDALIDDGRLDAEVFFGEGPRSAVVHVGAVLAGRHEEGRLSRQVKRVRIVTREPLPVQIDGEPFATTPVTLSLRPRALRLLVPAGAPAHLFQPPHPEEG